MWSYGAWSDAWNQEQEVVDLDKEVEKPIMKDLVLKKKIEWIIEKNVKEKIRWTEEYNQKYWETKMERNNKFDQLYLDKIEKVFDGILTPKQRLLAQKTGSGTAGYFMENLAVFCPALPVLFGGVKTAFCLHF